MLSLRPGGRSPLGPLSQAIAGLRRVTVGGGRLLTVAWQAWSREVDEHPAQQARGVAARPSRAERLAELYAFRDALLSEAARGGPYRSKLGRR